MARVPPVHLPPVIGRDRAYILVMRSDIVRHPSPSVPRLGRFVAYGAGAVLAGLLLAACSGSGTGETAAEARTPPNVAWTTSYSADTVRVTIDDPAGYYRVERVTLFGPDGRTAEAAELTRDSVGTGTGGTTGGGVRPSVGVGGGYSSRGGFGTGLGLGLSFPLGGGGGEPERRAVANTTTASIPVGDPAAYRADPSRWEIQATLASPDGERSYARFPAPAPAEPR